MSKHSYTEIDFKNAPEHKTTPLNATNLKHMEGGISDAFTDIRAVEDALAPINLDNGTNNTGSTIKAGTYFYVSGVICKAITDIANGETLTKNTNYKEVNDGVLNETNRGSVSVTANGVKTYGQLLQDLIAASDTSKLTVHSMLEIEHDVLSLTSSQYWVFTATRLTSNDEVTLCARMFTNNYAYYQKTLNGGITSFTDSIPNNGTEFKLYY